MIHIAIMKKKWGLVPKILGGTKTVESRWYKNKSVPWDKVNIGDTLYFKNSGEKVTVKSKITKVEQYVIENNDQALRIMEKYALADLGTPKLNSDIENYIKDKRYAIFVHFGNVEKVEPFDIDKKGFGMQSAWLTVGVINDLKGN